MTITITWNEIKDLLMAESTNASRTYNVDGVSHFEDIVIDDQAADSLRGVWDEANARLAEKMHEFLTDATATNVQAAYAFSMDFTPDLLTNNIKMYIVCCMLADWLSSVRPDYSKRYYDRAAVQMDDLLRKLYKKEPPV